jgi:hypothetical protein
VSAVVLALEVVGGLASNSLALLSDAGHVFADAFAIGLAWFASRQAERPANVRQTYGFHRAGILAALAEAATNRVSRYSRTEIRMVPTVDVGAVRREADAVARERRELDTAIQGVNWSTELLD